MTIGFWQSVSIIAVTALVTLLTRALPFLFFGGRRETPRVIVYLGRVLPPAIIAVLVVYCFKNMDFMHTPYGLCELVAAGVTAALHLWRRSTVLSIAGGTVCYMLLLRLF